MFDLRPVLFVPILLHKVRQIIEGVLINYNDSSTVPYGTDLPLNGTEEFY